MPRNDRASSMQRFLGLAARRVRTGARPSVQPDPAPGESLRSACAAVTTLTGTPNRSMRWARSRCSHRETRSGSVETMTSSYFSLSSVWRTASYGSVAPTIPCTCDPAAASSSGIASSSVMAASSVSGSHYGRGTRSVNLHGPRAARSVTAASSLGEAAVRCATMRIRMSLMMGSFSTSLSHLGALRQIWNQVDSISLRQIVVSC